MFTSALNADWHLLIRSLYLLLISTIFPISTSIASGTLFARNVATAACAQLNY
jgi:hypothetical protein